MALGWRRWGLTAALTFGSACGGGGSDTGEGGSTTRLGDETTAGSESSTGGTSTNGETETGECEDVCFLDFPCFGDVDVCLDDPTKILEFETVWCDEHELCAGSCACEGGSCEPKGAATCDEGALCVELGTPEHWPAADCIPAEQACGGPDAIPCAGGMMCETRVDLCDDIDKLGRCVPVPQSCDGEPVEPECGCDGQTYDSACARRMAGVDLADYGAC